MGATIATYVGQNRGAGRMDRVKQGVNYCWIMLLIWSVIEMVLMYFCGRYFTWLFVSPSQTDVINVSVTYFHTVFWAYPFLCTIFLFRNALQGMGYGLVPMMGGVFELVARTANCCFCCREDKFCGSLSCRSYGVDCSADPADTILFPYYEENIFGQKIIKNVKTLQGILHWQPLINICNIMDKEAILCKNRN